MTLELWEVLLLAVVQGVAEFLPISSSGHIVVLAALLAGGEVENFNITSLNIVLHLGTLASILVVYWRRVRRLIGEDRRLIGLLMVGTLPAVVVGLPIKKFASAEILNNPLLAGCMLVVTGLLLLWIQRQARGSRPLEDLRYVDALAIGASQAAAILPGLSRSGATITAGLYRGLSPQTAATFSFLLAIPAIAGAGLLELKDQWEQQGLGPQAEVAPLALALGALTSFLFGLVALLWLLRWLEGGKFHRFAWWCIPLGIAVIAWQLWP